MNTYPDKKSILRILLLIPCLVGFCVPVFACSPDVIYNNVDESEDLSSADWIYLELKDKTVPAYPDDEQYFQYNNQYLLLEDGTILDCFPEELFYNKEKAICHHSWEKATKKIHTLDGKGGCTVSLYNIDVCVKCHAAKNKVFDSKVIHRVCPHQK